ncbi:MAG: hypothetical protein A2017_06520 [Lentisphaerae bacterium GWF2_44_16]|nr:MAG: hypothetical protein A2017_06520 [Lentisphaerae bacterium GWF2_44_16]
MTVAVCFICGEFKLGSFTPCPSCGVFPSEDDDIIVSFALNDHFYDNIELENFGKAIKDGKEIHIPDSVREDFERIVEGDEAFASFIKNLKNVKQKEKKKFEGSFWKDYKAPENLKGGSFWGDSSITLRGTKRKYMDKETSLKFMQQLNPNSPQAKQNSKKSPLIMREIKAFFARYILPNKKRILYVSGVIVILLFMYLLLSCFRYEYVPLSGGATLKIDKLTGEKWLSHRYGRFYTEID